VADEPTGNLDSHTARAVWNLLQELAEDGKTVMVVTHDHEVTGFVDRVINLADGVIVSDIGRNSLLMLNLFSTFALLLSGVLVGSSVASMMARQVREIGVMKTVGATSGQIAGMHLAMMLGLGVGALVLKATAPGYVQ